ncbi:polycystin family receptor for egg jelly isoform X2 [Malaclemys terrapin pileata]|uniref:polycystin family receptor for egg jelly isoform X2 n=1 Tax=Malaclemys terrapin pileata TaxID=2991368 RepID=UPI0023A89BD7|nr:polycystin family receptor for egg jelly isoform X2 [Malaclemys terrapin pileata]
MSVPGPGTTPGPATAMPPLLLRGLLLQLLGCCGPPCRAAAGPRRFQLPPLRVTCSGPHGRVYRRQDSEVWASCLWDGPIELRYARAPGAVSGAQEGETQLPPPPRCRWYRDAAWVQDTSRWSGRALLGPGLAGGGPAPPWASSRITVQCESASCAVPTCLHRNLSIEVSGQDVRLFLLWPPQPPILEWQPVQLGWCARLKSSAWRYRFSSRGGSPAALLIPSNQHHKLLPPAAYPRAELHQVCASYYSYRLTVHYTRRGLYIASISMERGPQISLSLTLRVEPALLHVLSAHSKLFSLPYQPLSLSWRLQPLGPRTLAYRLLDMQGTEGWSASYNPYALRSNFCADSMPRQASEMALASIYFHVDGEWCGDLAGELSFSNATLGLTVNSETPTYLTLNAQKTKTGTYIFSRNHGLYYTTQANNASAPDDGFNTHYIFFQQQSLSFLLTIEFVRLQWYKFNMHLYLNRKGALFRSLVDRDIEVHIFNSGPSFLRSLIYIVWFIPVQHPMLQCEWTFNLQLFGSRKEYVIQNNTYTYDDHVRNAARFVRRSVLPFNPALYTGFVAKVNCTRSGLTPAVLKVTVNTYASKVMESLVSCQKKPCFIERLRIQKPDLVYPIIRTKKGLQLILYAKLQVNCTDLVRTEAIWKIYGVQNVTTIPDWTKPLNPPLIWRRQMLILPIPSFSLDYGLYLFNFSVKIIASEGVLEGSDTVFVQVEKSDLVAVIAGGTFRTVGFSDHWTLDGSTSSDPDSVDRLEGLTFTWYCTKRVSDYANMTVSTNGTCHPNQVDLKWIKFSGPTQTVLPETLQGNTVYHFRLVIQKDNRKSYADQTYSQKEPSPRNAAQNHPKESSPFMSGNLRNWKERLQKWYLAEASTQSVSSNSLENCSNANDSYSLQYFGKKRKQRTPKMWSNCIISEGAANAIAAEEENAADTSTAKAKTQQTQPPNSNFSNNYAEEKDASIQKERKPLNIPFMLFRKRPQITFCWWCVYVSWILVIVVAGVSSFFIVLYGLSYGYKTSLEWLLASTTSFFESVFLLQTLKIILFSALSTIYPKYCENIPWSTRENFLEIRLDEVTMDADEMREMHYEIIRLRGTKQYQPLEEDEMTIMRKREKIKSKVFIFLKDIVSHFVFLTLVLNIAYSTENTNSFYYNQVIHKQFSLKLSNVDKLEHIYLWVNNVFLPLIHNNHQPTFLSDSWSKILGLPRMRQVRAKSTEKKCFHPHSFVNKFVISKSHCLHKYGSDPEERGDYVGSWTKVANRSVTSDTGNYVGFTYQSNRNQWVYYSYGELYTYGPGGYTFYFFPAEQRPNSTKRLDVLQNSNWLDEETWAVIIELTTFNPDVHLFCSISVIFEVSHFGLINTSLSVHSFTLPIFQQQSRTQIFVFITVLAFLLIYIMDEIHIIRQERTKYIKNVSNLINFGLKSVFFFFVFLQVIKFKMGADIVKFYLLNPNDFIPFHTVSHVDQTLRIIMGFLAFLIVLKTLRYSRFFYDVRLAQRSILAALPGICSMALVVAVYFFVYMAFGYLVFGQHEWNYNNMIHSAQTVFSYCVSAFKDTAFTSNRLLGGLFLASFMLVMICVLINLFQAVIMSAYEDMKQPVYEEPSDEAEVITFLVHKIRRIWYFITCRTPSASDPDLLNSVLYGQAQRYSHRHLGLKTKKINGKKMVYLVI